jgi:hypothetical protein
MNVEEEGLKASESFPRRHYPDRVRGYLLSPAIAEHPCFNTLIQPPSWRFMQMRLAAMREERGAADRKK